MITKVVVQPAQRNVKIVLAGAQGADGPEGGTVLGKNTYRNGTTGNFYLKHATSGLYHRLTLDDVDGVATLSVNQTGTSSPT